MTETNQYRKFGTRIYDESGNVMALHGVLGIIRPKKT
jgi:hypothetical protein